MQYLAPASKKILPIIYEWQELIKTNSGINSLLPFKIYRIFYVEIEARVPTANLESSSNSSSPSFDPWHIM